MCPHAGPAHFLVLPFTTGGLVILGPRRRPSPSTPIARRAMRAIIHTSAAVVALVFAAAIAKAAPVAVATAFPPTSCFDHHRRSTEQHDHAAMLRARSEAEQKAREEACLIISNSGLGGPALG